MHNVLIIDDDTVLSELYKYILEKEKINVTIAENGEKGLVEMLLGKYDLVLLDINMPLMDGHKVMEKYNKVSNRTLNTKIFYLTNDKKDESISRGLAMNVGGYLIKSEYTPDKFVTKIKKELSMSGHAQVNTTAPGFLNIRYLKNFILSILKR